MSKKSNNSLKFQEVFAKEYHDAITSLIDNAIRGISGKEEVSLGQYLDKDLQLRKEPVGYFVYAENIS